jgi:hypothetical protein
MTRRYPDTGAKRGRIAMEAINKLSDEVAEVFRIFAAMPVSAFSLS